MRVTEVAIKLKVCKATVAKWIKKGKVKAIKTKPQWGGHWYWDISEEEVKSLGEKI